MKISEFSAQLILIEMCPLVSDQWSPLTQRMAWRPPVDTRRNNNVIMTSLLRHVSVGEQPTWTHFPRCWPCVGKWIPYKQHRQCIPFSVFYVFEQSAEGTVKWSA